MVAIQWFGQAADLSFQMVIIDGLDGLTWWFDVVSSLLLDYELKILWIQYLKNLFEDISSNLENMPLGVKGKLMRF